LFVLTYLYTPKVLPKVFVTNVTTNVKNYDSTTNIINQYPPNVTNINGTNVLTNILTNVVISGQTDAPAPVTTFPPTPVHAAENPSVPVLVPDKAHVSAYTPPTNPPDSDLTSPPKITLTAAPTNPVVSLTNPLQLTNVPIAMLTWSSSNATQVTLTGFGSVPFNGSTNVSPLQSTNYTITATSASGTNSASVTVYVPGAPQNLQVGPP
ncbi:MAG TPA: hypothetical protein VNU95_05770, partial [Candidatus Acidoferrales bacterium]|nr:hypothetical protein [Candidatus Acidoferrales bacterium]